MTNHTDDLYHEQLLEEARAPRNQGRLDNPDAVAVEFNASCGDRVELTLQLSEDKKTITDVKWQGAGCIISQAGLSVLTEQIKGKEVTKLQELEHEAILDWLGLESVAPGRIKCVTLGLSALKKALS